MSNRAKSSGISFPDLFVGPNSAVPGTGQIIHTAANLGFSPVSLGAWNTYYSLYVNETFDVATRLSVNAGARYNVAQIAMTDFSRFNPVVGMTYKILPEMTFYTGYSEANRAPTPLELLDPQLNISDATNSSTSGPRSLRFSPSGSVVCRS
jgi:iron complex outermembrane receptor protein